MSLNEKILLPSSIVFFAFCVVLIIHLFSEPSRLHITKAIFIYLLIYGGGISALEIYKGRNSPNYGISVGCTIGAAIGFVAGFYLVYQVCILAGFIDAEIPIESSSISLALSWAGAEIGRQIGSFLGNVLLLV